jgi:nitrogen regulatory protein PII 1
MKLILAIVRPSNLKDVTDKLSDGGFISLTEVSVRGRGKQKGINIGGMHYDKLPKEMLMLVCANDDVEKIVDIIIKTGRTGNMGDGKIFILNVEEDITIRTGERNK